nr:uncharacterized protein LOC100210508 isoform X1 [Hydra vulgaris]
MKYIVYFDDTHVDILNEEDVMLMDYEGYSIDDWNSLSVDHVVRIQAVWKDQPFDACLLQVVPNDDSCQQTINSLRHAVKVKNFGALRLMKYIKFRVRPNKRAPLQPLDNLTSGTDSDAFTPLFVKPLAVKVSEPIPPLCSPPLVPMHIFTPTSSIQHVDKNQLQVSSSIISKSFKPLACKVSTSDGPKTKRANSTHAVLHELNVLCNDAGIDSDTVQAVRSGQAVILQKLALISQRLDSLTHSTVKAIPLLKSEQRKVPLFCTPDDLANADIVLSDEIFQWMLQEGGRDSNDLCERLLNLLLSIDLAKQLNRSGKNGKLKLPVKLEKFIKDCVLTKFPNETRNVVELRIKRFLHNAKDKNGGRAARRNSKVPKEAVECNDLIIAKNNKDFDNEHPGPKCQNAAHGELSVHKKCRKLNQSNLFDESTDSD